ncbi:vWA domain-containing protein [Phytohabitans houttuyneae]|uniref:VWFA domain-containing protein n=1 Tax=Phytohabitans houttuyneae TaxID=1076126 RepID=A0A6V8K1W3_9ACTN|nr:hypothetical protein [Phytohabitans houttuyneae]GFJ76278.1 hypothetical protein Phou_004580 [Phytohabitans houttuyneae]
MTYQSAAPSDGARTAKVRTYLIYVVLDTSESMRRPWPEAPQDGGSQAHFVRLIPRMLRELADHPVTNKLASVSVLAFNDEPEILRPMTSLDQPAAIRPPRLGYGTDYARVLRFLADQHRKDVRAVQQSRMRDGYTVDVARPWIFFVTDGRPFARERNQSMDEWMGHRRRLTDEPVGARLAAIGLPGAERDILWHLATGSEDGRRNAFIADRRTNPKELSESVVDAIKSSISTSASTGLLTIRTPVGMRRIEGPRHG